MAWMGLLLIRGILPVAQVYLARSLVNSVLAAIRPGGDFIPAVRDAALMAATLLATEGLRTIEAWVRAVQSELVRNHISALVQEKSIGADIGFYETPAFFDHLHRARAEAATVPLALTENLGGLAQNGITLLAMAGVLLRFGVWLPVALVASALPALYVLLHFAARHHAWSVRTTADERMARYYDHVLTGPKYAPELRLFALGPYFRRQFDTLRGRLGGERIALARTEGAAEFLAAAVALAISGGALVWIAGRAVKGQATPGDLALFYQAFQQGSGLTRTLLSNVGQVYRNSLYLEGLFEFLGLEPRVVSPMAPKVWPREGAPGIRFRDITFRYPWSERLALENFNLDIPAGSIVALVGENGAGKSTLIKLLSRFYDPEAGAVEIDGVDVREFGVDDLRSRMAILFQDPAHYSATVASNIAPGQAPDPARIEQAARASGADVIAAKLSRGYNNLLGRMFEEGAELSGGEWQRIALARAFLKEAPILILDEPTSAMDPWNEADWLERFAQLAQGRTTLVVTHRFTTARIADTIAVMAGGA